MEGMEGVLERLLGGRYNKGKRVLLIESEIRQLCVTAKQIFLAQPNLLELEAPINICGTLFSFSFIQSIFLIKFIVFLLIYIFLYI